MRILFALLACLAIVGCDSQLGTQIARDQAKTVVNDVVEDRFPGVDATPISDCVIDNASGSEILEIAGAAVSGVSNQTIALVFEIAGRRETINCFSQSLGPLLIAGLLAAGV